MESSLDECPICYNAFREPKGLPCFHTFCRECLQIHIDNSSVDRRYFNCPMCRKRTVPFGDVSIPVSEWAKSFPTNNYVLNRYLEVSRKQCPSHLNEILDIHCKTCRVMICCLCCVGAHEKCEKTLTKFNAQRIKKNFVTHLEKMKVNLEPLENRLAKMDDNKKSMEDQIKEITQELSEFVQTQEQHWLQEIETAHLRESSTLREQRNGLTEIIESATLNLIDIDNQFGSEDLEDLSKSPATYDYQPRHTLRTMTTDSVEREEVNFQINPNFVKLKDELLKLNVAEIINPTSVQQTDGATSGNQLFIREFTLGSENLVGINDMVMLPDGGFLVTEACFKRLWKFSRDGQRLRDIYFDTEPYGLCLLQNNCVAISQPYERKISIFSCSNFIEIDTFSADKRYYGLGSDCGTKIFALYRDQTMMVDVIWKEGSQFPYEILKTIKLPNLFYFCDDYRVRVLPTSHVCIIHSVNPLNVACINQDGELAFRYEGDDEYESLTSIADIAVGCDYIYVADKSANKIHRIRHDGSFVDIPLCDRDGIAQPRKIFVNKLNGTGSEVLSILSKTNQNPKIQLFNA